MINAGSIVLGIVVLFNVGLGFLVYKHNRRSATNKGFVFLFFSICLWMIANYLCDQRSFASQALFWNRATMGLGAFMGSSFLYFALVFPKKSVKLSFFWKVVLLISVLFAPLSATGLVVKTVEFYSWGTNIIPGNLFFAVTAWAVVDILLTVALLVFKYWKSRGIEKMQFQYVCFGFFIFLLTILLTNLLLPVITGTNELAKFGPYSTVFLAGFFAYAIVKHRLMDIRLVVLKSAAYSVILAVVAGAYIAATYLFLHKYPGIIGSDELIILALIGAVFGVFPLRRLFERITDKIFAKGRYNPQELLEKLGEIISTEVKLEDLEEAFLKTLVKEMRLKGAAFGLFSGLKICNVKDIGLKGVSKSILKQAAKVVGEKKQVVLSDDLEEGSKEKDVLRKIKAEVIVPLYTGKELIGILSLGEKKSGDMFTLEDLKVFESIAPQIATGVKKTIVVKERDEAKEKRMAELNSLNSIVLSLSSTLNLDQVLAKVIEEALRVTEAECGSIMLLDEETKTLSIAASKGINPEVTKDTKVRLGEGVSGWAAQKGEPLLLVDGKNDDLYLESFLNREDVTSSLAVPLMVKGKVIGVLNASRKKKEEVFTQEDLTLISSFAAHAAEHLENARFHKKSEDQFMETINSLSKAVDAKDHYTHGHSEAVTTHAVEIAEEMGLPEDEIRNIKIAARLHDIGKIGIPGDILNKPAQLTHEEREIICEHPKIAVKILQEAESLGAIKPLIHFHHERFDGKGYPAGLSGTEIPLGARILAVADSFNAMVTRRPYRPALSFEEACRELQENAETQFDPKVVEAFLRILKGSLPKQSPVGPVGVRT